jgi:hypothetical protein
VNCDPKAKNRANVEVSAKTMNLRSRVEGFTWVAQGGSMSREREREI